MHFQTFQIARVVIFSKSIFLGQIRNRRPKRHDNDWWGDRFAEGKMVITTRPTGQIGTRGVIDQVMDSDLCGSNQGADSAPDVPVWAEVRREILGSPTLLTARVTAEVSLAPWTCTGLLGKAPDN